MSKRVYVDTLCMCLSSSHVQEWRSYTSRHVDVTVTRVAGNHLWPIAQPAAKATWLQDVAAALQAALPST